jgi:DNA-binding NtrC family response regulator
MNRILFVDDEPNTLQGYQRALRRHFRIETALGPLEALKAVRSNGPYAVVVADIKMPQMSGIELFAEIRKIEPGTVRIILTGNADQQSAIDAHEQGHVFCYLNKPCSPKILVDALNSALSHYATTGLPEKEPAAASASLSTASVSLSGASVSLSATMPTAMSVSAPTVPSTASNS